MLGGVKEANYIIAFEITLMKRAMIQASYVMLTHSTMVCKEVIHKLKHRQECAA